MSLNFSGASPASWSPFVRRIREASQPLEVASDLQAATREAATIAAICGSCHQSQGVVVVDHQAVPPPIQEDRFSNYMVQHRWATNRLWEGLIGPSNDAWKAGVKVLATTELTVKDVDERLIVTSDIVQLIARLQRWRVTPIPLKRERNSTAASSQVAQGVTLTCKTNATNNHSVRLPALGESGHKYEVDVDGLTLSVDA